MRKVVLIIILITIGMVVEAGEEWGYLDIYNRVESLQVNHDIELVKDDEYLPNASDGLDQYDIEQVLWMPSDVSGIHSIVENKGLYWDVRPNQSTTPYDISLVIHNSFLSEEKSNYLEVEFRQFEGEPYADFGGKPILFQQTSSTNPSAFYPVYDLRKAMAQNSGVVPLENVAAGSYNKNNPYGSGILTMGVRFLADLNDSNDVNLEDFAIFKVDWKQSGSGLVSDICGVNGIPDGTVDMFDLICFLEEWLKDINDPSTW